MCEHCNIKNCPVLNKTECPINQLWARAEEAKQTIKEIEATLHNEVT